MDSKSFVAILKKPHRLADAGFSELIDLGNKYPYASLLHTLIAKKSEKESPEDFDSYLAKAAIYSLNRKKLYFLIHNVPAATSKENIEETADTVVMETSQPEISDAVIEIPETSVVENGIADISDNIKPIEISTESILQQLDAIDKEKKDKKKKKEKKKHEEEDVFAEITVDAKLSFIDWLKYISKHRKPPEKELEKHYAAAQYEAEITKEEIVDEETTIPSPPPSIWKKVSSEKAEVIISDLAEKSIKKDESNITETFAKILELQKKYPQAIDAYAKLSLKYPEKSVFFALRIEELKKKI